MRAILYSHWQLTYKFGGAWCDKWDHPTNTLIGFRTCITV